MSYGSLSKPAVRALSAARALPVVILTPARVVFRLIILKAAPILSFRWARRNMAVATSHGMLDEEKLAAIASKPQVKMIEVKLAQGPSLAKAGFCRPLK